MTSNKYKMDPACGCKRVSPRLNPLLYKTMRYKLQGTITIQQTIHLCHPTDVVELIIDFRKRTTFNVVVRSCHNDSLARLRTRLSGSNVVFACELTSLHEA